MILQGPDKNTKNWRAIFSLRRFLVKYSIDVKKTEHWRGSLRYGSDAGFCNPGYNVGVIQYIATKFLIHLESPIIVLRNYKY